MQFGTYPAQLGTLISIPTHVFYRHFGIVTARGTVISNSARHGGAREETFEQFCVGRNWRIEPSPSNLPYWAVLQRAAQLMDRPYNVLTWNCESFVKASYGLSPSSDQVIVSALLALGGVAIVLSLGARA
jgi:hypothetical protein